MKERRKIGLYYSSVDTKKYNYQEKQGLLKLAKKELQKF